eukprot:CAMPEP_0172447828 /NCGR_PEP_ID=MMETSP1065-20121228/7020_1 /TAXON_ID=265537 /ORGANISM="Amphiprora paludosa, Strain CCMP125" /LENGTH=398 /DNA_ID=CAMNT_0013199199 /DNA_START=24 /DNA_END=1220 /DNA_ORIENTATION=-
MTSTVQFLLRRARPHSIGVVSIPTANHLRVGGTLLRRSETLLGSRNVSSLSSPKFSTHASSVRGGLAAIQSSQGDLADADVFRRRLFMALGVLAMGGAMASTQRDNRTTFCEEAAAATSDPAPVVETEEEEEEDPYANLPEEDEPTECSMCNTFRQGPCRTPWRKLERCFKDHEDQEGGATKCMKYFLPHQECLMKYANMYLLVGNEMKQELISDVESSFSNEERREITVPDIDWSLYHEFLRDQGPDFRQSLGGLPKSTPLWQRLPPDTEPVLISLETKLPNVDEKTGWILKVAFVLDQDGKVIGFQYNEAYGELMKLSTGEEPEKRTPMEQPVKVSFVVMPGETSKIRIKAYYSENPVDAGSEKEILDGCICETSLHAIPTMADLPPSTDEASKKE